ncbi:MAG: NTP transferase domain-containing protein [Steroidobacteraceae bacterium]
MTAGLYGLVLAGGRSSRMKRDKAALTYHGRSQLERTVALLTPFVERCFVSVRADQQDDPLRANFERIVDERSDVGPLAGILAAQRRYPDVAWWVVACDLPFLEPSALEQLRRERDRQRPATAFRSTHDGLPEPLCTIYEPHSAVALAEYADSGRSCPRKFLIQREAKLLEPLAPQALDNVNSAQEYWQAMQTLSPNAAVAPRTLRVRYFAVLREQAGRSEETLETTARSPAELYAELRSRHPFTLPPELLRVAVNDEFGDWSQPLAAGDVIVFIPPVAGG